MSRSWRAGPRTITTGCRRWRLIGHWPAVIAAFATAAANAAKAATTAIPIVFGTIADPVQIGLVTSLNHPSGNITGVSLLGVEVGPKLLELLHEAVPSATILALLVNPTNPNATNQSKMLQSAGCQAWSATSHAQRR